MISASEFQVLLISHVILHSHHFSFCSPAGKIIEDTLQFSGENFEFETGFPHFQIISDTYIWVNYNDLSATSLGIMVNKRNQPQMALIQYSETL